MKSQDKRRVSSGQSGFTLVELLVVVAILGLLAAIATPMVLRHLADAKVDTAQVQISQLATALDLYKLDNGRYPTTEEGLVALTTAPPDAPRWRGPYLSGDGSLVDPWGHAYIYHSPGETKEFDLSTSGPGGPANGGKGG